MMKLKLRSLLTAAVLLLLVNAAGASAQVTQRAYDPLAELPTSDVVSYADVRRIMTEVVPRVLAKDPATLLKMTNAVTEVNTKTGINLLSIDRIAAGMQFLGHSLKQLKKDEVGL